MELRSPEGRLLVTLEEAAEMTFLQKCTLQKYIWSGRVAKYPSPYRKNSWLVDPYEVMDEAEAAAERMRASHNPRTATQPRDANNQYFVRGPRVPEGATAPRTERAIRQREQRARER